MINHGAMVLDEYVVSQPYIRFNDPTHIICRRVTYDRTQQPLFHILKKNNKRVSFKQKKMGLLVDGRLVFGMGNVMLLGRPRSSQLDLLEPSEWENSTWDPPVKIDLPSQKKVVPPVKKKKKKTVAVKRERPNDDDDDDDEDNLRPWFRYLVSSKGATDRPVEMQSPTPLTFQEFQKTNTYQAVQRYLKFQRK